MILDLLGQHRSREPTAAVRASPVAAAPTFSEPVTETTAMRLSAVNRCVEVLSDSMAKLPCYVMDEGTKERPSHALNRLLSVRPNEAMTPFTHRKLLESQRLLTGNAYEWILRDPRSGRPAELIPLPSHLVTVWQDRIGRIWYDVVHPWTGEIMRLPSDDVNHFKAYTRDGIHGISTLAHAAEVIQSASAAQQYAVNFYEGDAQPNGVLTVDTDLSGYADVLAEDGSTKKVAYKDLIREDWERVHRGPSNSHRIAILDHGMKYQQISASMKDAQYVESLDMSVQDIGRFFGVPLYKLNAGKQSYSSNEQNAVEFITGTLHPIVCQYEQERTYKLLLESELAKGLEIRINMMAELKGDNASRANWYKTMRETGVFSVNDIRELEDLPNVAGGDSRLASLNFVPLEQWEKISTDRNEVKR